MPAYYNENDRSKSQWLRNLIEAGLIAAGDVDERSIVDVRPDDLRGYEQCHFFAGIGGWSLAMRLAGVADTGPAWTGSCPCQRISGLGSKDDEWREWQWWRRLLQQCRPAIVFGEQVTGGLGPRWLAGVRADVEADGAAFGGANLPAGGFGAPQERERFYFVGVGYAKGERWRESIRALRPPAGGWPQARQSPWAGEIVLGNDGTRRRLKPGIELLVNGLSGRMADLRGFGDAIVPEVAAKFIAASIEAIREIE